MAASKWTAHQVEEYLTKFQVEAVVQHAVNSAISHRAVDPILHIADFLEARGLEIESATAAAVEQPVDLPDISTPTTS